MTKETKRKQYIVSGVAVTFTPVEERRVLKKAAKLGASVEDLIYRAIGRKKSYAAISRSLNALGSATTRTR